MHSAATFAGSVPAGWSCAMTRSPRKLLVHLRCTLGGREEFGHTTPPTETPHLKCGGEVSAGLDGRHRSLYPLQKSRVAAANRGTLHQLKSGMGCRSQFGFEFRRLHVPGGLGKEQPGTQL